MNDLIERAFRYDAEKFSDECILHREIIFSPLFDEIECVDGARQWLDSYEKCNLAYNNARTEIDRIWIEEYKANYEYFIRDLTHMEVNEDE